MICVCLAEDTRDFSVCTVSKSCVHNFVDFVPRPGPNLNLNSVRARLQIVEHVFKIAHIDKLCATVPCCPLKSALCLSLTYAQRDVWLLIHLMDCCMCYSGTRQEVVVVVRLGCPPTDASHRTLATTDRCRVCLNLTSHPRLECDVDEQGRLVQL